MQNFKWLEIAWLWTAISEGTMEGNRKEIDRRLLSKQTSVKHFEDSNLKDMATYWWEQGWEASLRSLEEDRNWASWQDNFVSLGQDKVSLISLLCQLTWPDITVILSNSMKHYESDCTELLK